MLGGGHVTIWRNAAVVFLRLGVSLSSIMRQHALLVLQGETGCSEMRTADRPGSVWSGLHIVFWKSATTCSRIATRPAADEPSHESRAQWNAMQAAVRLLLGDHTFLLTVSLLVWGSRWNGVMSMWH